MIEMYRFSLNRRYQSFAAWLLAQGEQEGTNEEIWNANKKRLSKLAANWMTNRLMKILGDRGEHILHSKVSAENFAEFLTFIERGRINSTTAQAVLEKMIETAKDPTDLIEKEGLEQGER